MIELKNILPKFCLRTCLVLCTLQFVAISVFSQKGEKFIRDNPEKFIEQLSAFFDDSKKGYGKEFIEKEFGPLWIENNKYSASNQQRIYSTLDEMSTNKCKVFPEFDEYIKAIIAFEAAGKPDEEFVTWDDVLNKIIKDKKLKRILPTFLETSHYLFQENVFYRSESVSWKSSSPIFSFVFDTVPRIEFKSLDLKCYSKGDSSIIYRTAGNYFPTLDRFIGKGGSVTWQRAGFDPARTFAEIPKYNIRVKGSTFVVDSVIFHNEFFDKPLVGQLTEKIIADKTTDNATYPKFESYYKRLQIQNIVKNVDYEGGFTMAGTKLAGSGTQEQPALLTFYRDNKRVFVARSLEFDIQPKRISSAHCGVTLFLEKDSIYHPDINFSFDRAGRKMTLLRSEEGVSNAPFQNTYHNLDMYFDAFYWNIDDPLIKLGPLDGGSQRYSAFESNTFFKKKRYDLMMGASTNHPLYEIKQYTKSCGCLDFEALDLARFTNHSEAQWHMVLIDLNNKGFIDYDINAHRIHVREKTFGYIENTIGKRDYDVLQFNSEVDKGNAGQLSLLNYDLQLKGVQSFQLSDSQNVTIYPSKGEVIVRKNRDFAFGGRVFAGNFEFMGSDYFFNYKEFQLDLLKVDSCRIYVEDDENQDLNGLPKKRRLKSVLRDIAGYIRIDAPTNKGGYHSRYYPQYPVFTCTKTSYVYWDNSDIQKGVYKRDKFYYQVQPFTIDSLDNFTKKDLKFNGTLVSGIFPDITEPLVLMDDYSLGFKRGTGDSGLPAYGGKAKVTADLQLNYSGLKGGGQLDYLTSSSKSSEFTFLPDSTLGRTTSFTNREQTAKVEIPKAVSDTTQLAFYPTMDRLNISSIGNPIDFFEKEADLTGTLSLKPSGMTGEGLMTFSGASLTSKLFEYTRRKILADTSNFSLKSQSDDNNALAFKTDNVNSSVDFDKRQGVFKSNGGETKIEFPVNQYICFMDQFTWYMDKAEMDLSSNRKAADDLVIDTSEDSKRSNFFSVAAGQDSLNFLSPRAKYDLKSNKISCSKIDYIIVADSKVTPDSGKVVIERYANMLPLQRAMVLSNYTTQYHKLFNAELKIDGRKKYSGNADIRYIDEAKTEQTIHLEELKVDTSLQTVGKGKIDEDAKFFLSPVFEYFGKFELYANQPNLIFDGGVKILHNCANSERSYFKFRSEINPNEIYIPVDSGLVDMDMTKLAVGVMVNDDTPMSVYPAFLSPRQGKSDKALVRAAGFLFYDKASKKYLIGSKEKIKQPKLAGNLVSLSADNCNMSSDGRIEFDTEFGLVKMNNAGEITYTMAKNEMVSQGVCYLNFPFDEGAMKRLSNQIEQFPNLNSLDLSKTKYEKGLIEFLGTEKSDKVISELNLNGQLKRVPEELQCTFYFGDLKWIWNPADESFQTLGQLGIASMDKKQLFRYVKGKIEIEQRRSADVLRIYVELDQSTWYYFEYKLGIMNVISTDPEFQKSITDLKDDKRKFEEKNVKYTYQIVTSKKKRDDFVDRFPDLQ